MRKSVKAWPGILFIDATYKLFRRGFSLFLIIVMDSDHYSHLGGVAILTNQKAETLEAAFKCFKNENQEALENVKVIFTDKDLTERHVLKKIFKNALLYLCKFHVLQALKREITPAKMETSAEKILLSLELLDKMVQCSTEKEFEAAYQKFCKIAPQSALDYYYKNWHPIREEWATYHMIDNTLANTTNNRTESMNNNIKLHVPVNSTLCTFVNKFFGWLNTRNKNVKHKLAMQILKVPTVDFEPSTPEYKYRD